MKKSELKKKIKVFGFLILILGTITMGFNFIAWNNSSQNSSFNEKSNEELEEYGNNFDSLKTADYTPNYSSTGGNLDISLQQSNITIGTPLFEITNASDPTNITFYSKCPKDPTFNSTRSQVFVKDIFAPNRTLSLENDTTDNGHVSLAQRAFSFSVLGDGVLENLTLYLSNQDTDPGDIAQINIDLMSATAVGLPSNTVVQNLATTYIVENNTAGFHTWINLGKSFKSTQTENNLWFIRIIQIGGSSADLYLHGALDDPGGTPPEPDDSEDYYYFGGWDHQDDLDFYADIGLAPIGSNTPFPADISLKINNTPVSNTTQGEGNTIINKDFTSLPSQLDYNITAEWWDVSCNITKIQVNYTKSDLKASTNFTVLGSAQSIRWNATRIGGLNYFNTNCNNYKINFTVPANWQNFQAFNGTNDNKSDYISFGPIVNGYKELQISNAGNGTYWFINATSDNLLRAIDTFVSSVKTNITNYGETIDIIGNFTETIKDGNATVEIYSPDFAGNYLNYTYYNDSFSDNNEVDLGSWTITGTPIDYGQFRVQLFCSNGTVAGFLEKNFTVFGETELQLTNPLNESEYLNDETFNITVYYNDTGQISAIANAIIDSNNSNVKPFYNTGTPGYYTTEVNTSDFTGYGWHYIKINATKTYYNNDSIVFSFQKIINTTIEPESYNFGDVIRGDTVSYDFNYSDTDHNFILGAEIEAVDVDSSFICSNQSKGQGNYTISLNTTNVDASAIPYLCNFSISAPGNETQYIALQLRVVIDPTTIAIQSYNSELARKDQDQINQTVIFYFNDTHNNKSITGLTPNSITVIDSQTALPRSKWLYPTIIPGLYVLSISISGLNSGSYRYLISASHLPNYDLSSTYIDFYLRGNYTNIPNITLSDPEGQEQLTSIGGNYSIFEERDLYVDFNITDNDYNDNLITSAMDSYTIEFIEIGNSTNQGFLNETLSFDANTNSFKGYISITDLPRLGAYTITIRTSKTNYEEGEISFNVIIKERYEVELSIVSQPDEVTAGDTFRIIFEAQFNNGSNWFPLTDSNIIITPVFDGITSQEILTKSTNSTGGAFFEITIARNVHNMSLSVRLEEEYYHVESSLEISDIIINPAPLGFNFEDLLPYLIIIGAAVAVGGGSFAVYRGAIVPKRREKARILTEVKTIFDDAISLEHVLVLYKGTGVCIYFKSFGSEQIDPELISGFISAISSFGKDLVSQEELNEISYGDKMLLLSDGDYIRVALVLSKQASLILRRNLMEFIHAFEKVYAEDLPKWRGQLNIFRDAGIIIDDIFSTSIILPHEITYEHSSIKTLKKPQSREVIRIADNLMKDSERNFFFIATLLKEATEKTGRDTAEIFMGIKELRDNKILMPIEISAIEKKPISQQEMNLIGQKVGSLVNLSPEEKQKLVVDLSQMGPAEREAYFVSLSEQHEIVSAPVESEAEAEVIETLKQGKKEIKNLIKKAVKAKKENDYEKSIKIYQNAAKIALNWELVKESEILDDTMRMTKIEDLTIKMKNLENEAKLAVKEEKFNEASQKYRASSKMASEIFKLGVDDMTKEVKRLTNKSKEYEKLV